MSEYTTGPTPGPADDQPSTDLSVYFSAEQLAELEQAMQSEAALTDTGRRGAVIGTLIEPTAPKPSGGWLKPAAQKALPTWCLSAKALGGALRHSRNVATYRLIFHGARAPLYGARIALLAGYGAGVAIRTAFHFALAWEYNEAIRQAKKARDHAQVLALRNEKSDTMKDRLTSPWRVAAAASVGLYVLATVITAAAGAFIVAGPLIAALLVTLAAYGYRHKNTGTDEPAAQILDAIPAGKGPITDPRIINALATAGLLKGDIKAQPVGPSTHLPDGSAIHIYDLTGGLTAEKVHAKATEIAGLLHLPVDQVDISRGEHESQIVVWTATTNPFKEGRPSPLFGKGGRIEPTDIWNVGVPVGFDRRGNVVYLRLRHVMALLGGMSQTGKGMILRNVVPALALDTRVNIRLVSGRKAAELASFAPVCATFFGNREERLLALLRAFKAEADRRDDYVEENGIRRVTESMLAQFPLEILIIDEAQVYSDNPEIMKLLVEVSGYAASLNMTVLLITQDPDAHTIPPKFKKNTKSRVATKTATAAQTNAILNDGATGNGMAAHHIPVSTPGLAIIDADGAPGVLIRGFFIEDREHDGVLPLVEAAVEMRRAAGRLPGQFKDVIEDALIAEFGTSSAAGGPKGMGRPGAVVRGILADLLAVFEHRGMPERITTAELLAGLAARHPDVWSPAALDLADGFEETDYSRVGGAALAKAISESLAGTTRKLSSRQWKENKVNVSGFWRDDLKTAAGLS
jgi:S-DNA-T family DNA segregation ATPase FtsK/SpoIIIE